MDRVDSRPATAPPSGPGVRFCLRVVVATLVGCVINFFVCTFANYDGISTILFAPFRSLAVTLCGLFWAIPLGALLLIPIVGRWWRASVLPAGWILSIGLLLMWFALVEKRTVKDPATKEEIVELDETYLPGMVMLLIGIVHFPVGRIRQSNRLMPNVL